MYIFKSLFVIRVDCCLNVYEDLLLCAGKSSVREFWGIFAIYLLKKYLDLNCLLSCNLVLVIFMCAVFDVECSGKVAIYSINKHSIIVPYM